MSATWFSHLARLTHDVLEHTGESENKTRSDRDEEHSRNLTVSMKYERPGVTHIEGESNTGVGEQDKEPNSVQSVEWLETLGKGDDTGVDDRADRSVVVERDDGVHLKGQR